MAKNKQTYPSIPKYMLAYMAWKNLVSKKLRSGLTIAGIVIGIGSIFFLLSLGLGLQNLVTNEIIGNQSIKSIEVTSPNSRIIKLDQESSERIASLGNVDKLGSSYTFAGSVSFSSSEVDAVVYGTDEAYQDISNISTVGGVLISNDDMSGAYINTAMLQAIGVANKDDVIGKKIALTVPLSGRSNNDTEKIDEEYTVIGVIDSGSGGEVFVNRKVFDHAEIDQYSQIKLVSNNTDNLPALRQQIESMGFETSSPIDTIDQINQIFRYFNLVLGGFGVIGMIIAILGMFNTVTISLLERTREIGLMVAIGARHKDMRILFLLESILLSLIGSFIGIMIASLLGSGVNLVMNSMASSRGVTDSFDLFSTPIWLILALVLFMVLIGLIVTLIPSRRAEKINPIDALRRE